MPTSTSSDAGPIDLTAALSDGITRLTSSSEWERYLAFQAAFHQYSFGNVILIASQRPGATRVAGFSTWRAFGRWVRRGEKAIWILAPIRRRVGERRSGTGRVDDGADDRDQGMRLVGFRRVAVFDISQTDGAPPPEVVRRLSGQGGREEFAVLIEHARSLGYAVEQSALDGASNGDCDFVRRRIRVEASNSPVQRTKTLVHELAHVCLHESEPDRALAELEAESVAFIVCRAAGLDTSAYTFGYVASWAGGGDEAVASIRVSGERISSTAAELIKVLRDATTSSPSVEASVLPRNRRALVRVT